MVFFKNTLGSLLYIIITKCIHPAWARDLCSVTFIVYVLKLVPCAGFLGHHSVLICAKGIVFKAVKASPSLSQQPLASSLALSATSSPRWVMREL